MRLFISIFLFINISLRAQDDGFYYSDTAILVHKVKLDLASNILFKNRDRLQGNFIGIAKKSGQLKWRSPEVQELISFKLSSISQLNLNSMQSPVVKSKNSKNITIYLSNGDIIPGVLSELTETRLKIKTLYADEITIPRVMINKIYFNSSIGNIYQGPNSREEWVIKQKLPLPNNFKVKDSTLIIAEEAVVATDIKTADNLTISFTVMNPDKNRNWGFALFSNKDLLTAEMSPDGYLLKMKNQQLTLVREAEDDGQDDLARFSLPNSSFKSPLQISITIDKLALTFIISVNGKQMYIIKDTYDEFAGTGTSLAFVNTNSNTPLSISNILVSEGSLIGTQSRSSKEKSTEDFTFLNNGDKISGHLKHITDGIAIFSTDFAMMKIPLDRIYKVEMSEKQQEKAKRRKGDILIQLANFAGKITLQLESATETVIIGTSDNYGRIPIKIPYCYSCKFNIYAPSSNDEDIQVPTDDNRRIKCITID